MIAGKMKNHKCSLTWMHGLLKVEGRLSTSLTRCLAISELHFSTLTEPFNYAGVSLDDAGRIANPLIAIVVAHADAAVIVLPLAALAGLVVPDPGVKA